jgi:hypothetical protein
MATSNITARRSRSSRAPRTASPDTPFRIVPEAIGPLTCPPIGKLVPRELRLQKPLANTDPSDEPRKFDPLNRAGVKLAVRMLEELESKEGYCATAEPYRPSCAEECGLEAQYRAGRPQRDIVREYLDRAHAAGAEVESSFTRVVSDFVSQCRGGGGVPDTENYRRVYLSRRSRS